MKYLLLSLVAVPAAGLAYLAATKQELSFEGGSLHLEKRGTRKAKDAAKELLNTTKEVAGAVGGAKAQAATGAIDRLKDVINKAKDSVGDVNNESNNQQELPLEQPKDETKESESV